MFQQNKKSGKKNYCVIVNAIVVKNGRILICQRSIKERHVPGKWSPVGGKLEEEGMVWNALEKTAKREVLEEAGIKVEDKMYFLVNNTFNHEEDNLLVVSVVFLCKYKSGKARPLEDTTAIKWINKDEIDSFEFTHPNVKNYIIKAFEFLKNHHQ